MIVLSKMKRGAKLILKFRGRKTDFPKTQSIPINDIPSTPKEWDSYHKIENSTEQERLS